MISEAMSKTTAGIYIRIKTNVKLIKLRCLQATTKGSRGTNSGTVLRRRLCPVRSLRKRPAGYVRLLSSSRFLWAYYQPHKDRSNSQQNIKRQVDTNWSEHFTKRRTIERSFPLHIPGKHSFKRHTPVQVNFCTDQKCKMLFRSVIQKSVEWAWPQDVYEDQGLSSHRSYCCTSVLMRNVDSL